MLVLIFDFHICSLHSYLYYVIQIGFGKLPHIAKDEISLKIRFMPGAFKATPRHFQGVFDKKKPYICKQVDMHSSPHEYA